MDICKVLRELLHKGERAVLFELENHTVNYQAIAMLEHDTYFLVQSKYDLVDFGLMIEFNDVQARFCIVTL